jgi:hypothetical protein
MGEGGIAEAFNLAPATAKRQLRELDKAEIVIRDQRARLIYVRGSVEQDGPTTRQAVSAFRSQLAEMPPDSPVTIEVRRAIEVFLADPEREKVRTWWLQVADTAPDTTAVSAPVTGAVTDAATGSQPYPTPIPAPRTDPAPASDARAARVPSGGSLHLKHAACSPNLAWCVPEAVHAKLESKLSTRFSGDLQKSNAALKTWYATVWASLKSDHVMRDEFGFWMGRFDADFATKDAPTPKPDERVSTVPGAAETRAAMARARA